MNVDMEALARRAVACKGWRWMPGMLCIDDLRVVATGPVWLLTANVETGGIGHSSARGCLPDLGDPATLGCLLALVREAWGDDALRASDEYDLNGERWWSVNSTLRRGGDLRACGLGRSEAEALVAALEAAP